MKRSIYVAEVDAIVHFDDERTSIVDIESASGSCMGTWTWEGITRSFVNFVAPQVIAPLNKAIRAARKERREGGPCLDVPRPTPWVRPKYEPYTGPVATSCVRSATGFIEAPRRRS